MRWSYEGSAGAEQVVTRVAAPLRAARGCDVPARRRGAHGEERTTARAAEPVVPLLHQVSALTFLAVKQGIVDPGMRTLIAPLITFLPGSALTTATVELTSGEMVAGASRLVFGGMQLLLLAFGILAGAELAGLPNVDVLDDTGVNLLGWWAPWLGLVVSASPPPPTSPHRAARWAGSSSYCSPHGSASSPATGWSARRSAGSSARW